MGGEPFEQARRLAIFAREVQAAGVSVMAFTGYTLDDQRGASAPEGSDELLETTDLLVDGAYIAAALDTTRPWVGSRNQRCRFLADRYVHLKPQL